MKYETSYIPNFIKHIITLSFPEYDIEYNQTKRPHLVIKDGYKSKYSITDEIKDIVPYLSFYPEKYKIKYSRYRASGYPLHQFLTVKETGDNLSYIPFIAYSKENYNFLLSTTNNNLSFDKPRDIVYVFRHCVKIRDDLVKFMMNSSLSVDSYGKCLNNKPEGIPGSYNDLKALYNQYKFTISMEHFKKPGYITEKIINSFEANSIPTYWGDHSINDFFNKDSYINVDDFTSYNELQSFLEKLSKDESKLSAIINAPKLTDKGKQLFQINLPTLSEDARIFLLPIANKVREEYNNWYK